MLLGSSKRSSFTRCLILLLIVLSTWLPSVTAWSVPANAHSSGTATTSASNGAAPAAVTGTGVSWKICQPPPMCFASQAAKDKWAAENHCRFLEDICTKGGTDNQGAPAADEGFWGSIWSGVQSGLTYGYEFVKGLFTGLKGQITDLIDLISNPGEVISGLIDLGKAFYNDPKGTIAQLGELLGQEAVDTLTRATQCGAYDLGNVIGSYVSPALTLKLASRLTKYGGKLADAVKTIKHDIGCASFAAGTLVATPEGTLPIEQVRIGQLVLSRNEASFADAPRLVEQTFGRIAPSYRLLKTDLGTLTLTDEHPLWVQGKGWTEAHEIAEDDVIAGELGDVLVQSNLAVDKPLRVYNFTVSTTHNYFVGGDGIWAHNAKCVLPMPYKAPKSPSNYALGATDGGPGKWMEIGRPPTSPYKFEKQVTGAPPSIEYEVNGVKFDGYDTKTGKLLDAKNYTETNIYAQDNPDPRFFEIMRNNTLKEAQRQIAAANGVPIEWHVSNQKSVNELRKIFQEADLDIQVIYTPDIVN